MPTREEGWSEKIWSYLLDDLRDDETQCTDLQSLVSTDGPPFEFLYSDILALFAKPNETNETNTPQEQQMQSTTVCKTQTNETKTERKRSLFHKKKDHHRKVREFQPNRMGMSSLFDKTLHEDVDTPKQQKLVQNRSSFFRKRDRSADQAVSKEIKGKKETKVERNPSLLFRTKNTIDHRDDNVEADAPTEDFLAELISKYGLSTNGRTQREQNSNPTRRANKTIFLP